MPAAKKKTTKKLAAKKPMVAIAIETIAFETPAAFSEWLAAHHAGVTGIWIEFAKKGSGIASLTYAEAVPIALAYGWIDGQAHGIDERRYRQRFTPRRAQSVWSKINRERALKMIEEGTMMPAGLAEVERAQRDGRWDRAYDSPKNAKVPDDLAAALAKKPKAAKFFATLDSQNRYAILHRLMTAKTPETRGRRLDKFVGMLVNNEKIYP